VLLQEGWGKKSKEEVASHEEGEGMDVDSGVVSICMDRKSILAE